MSVREISGLFYFTGNKYNEMRFAKNTISTAPGYFFVFHASLLFTMHIPKAAFYASQCLCNAIHDSSPTEMKNALSGIIVQQSHNIIVSSKKLKSNVFNKE